MAPHQQLKQSFQTFAALLADETRQLTSQTQTVLQDELSFRKVIPTELFKSLLSSAVSLDGAVIDPSMQATRCGRFDSAEVCCTFDSLLSGAVTSIGGRTVQYSHWNGFDLTTQAGPDARRVGDPSLYHTAHTTISIKIKFSSDTNEHSGRVSLACGARLVLDYFWDRCGVRRVLVVAVLSQS